MATARVRLGDSELARLLGNAAIRREFPFVATMYLQHKSGTQADTGCCGKKNRQNTPDWASMKKTIATLPPDQKAKLKQHLDTRQVEVTYNNGHGKQVTMRF